MSYIQQARQEIPKLFVDKYEYATALAGAGIADLLLSGQEQILHIGSTAELLGGFALSAVGAFVDIASTRRLFRTNDEALASGIDIGLYESNMMMNRPMTAQDLDVALKRKRTVITQAGVILTSLVSPYVGFGLGGARFTAAWLNRRKEKLVKKALDFASQDQLNSSR